MTKSEILRGVLKLVGIGLICVFLCVYLVGILFVGPFLLINYLDEHPKIYVTTDTADYGIYDQGSTSPEYVVEYIEYFFPEKIEEDFQDVHYEFHCTELCFRGLAFEAYLEFTFDSDARYEQYVQDITGGMELPVFRYDSSFYEYGVQMPNNHYVRDYIVTGNPTSNGTAYYITMAQVSKILFCPEENRVIYIAISSAELAADTAFLGTYLRRFNIDPTQYSSADVTAGENVELNKPYILPPTA